MPQIQYTKKRRGNASLTGRTTRVEPKPYWPEQIGTSNDKEDKTFTTITSMTGSSSVDSPIEQEEHQPQSSSSAILHQIKQQQQQQQQQQETPKSAWLLNRQAARSRRRKKSQAWKDLVVEDSQNGKNYYNKISTLSGSLPEDLQTNQQVAPTEKSSLSSLSNKKRKRQQEQAEPKSVYDPATTDEETADKQLRSQSVSASASASASVQSQSTPTIPAKEPTAQHHVTPVEDIPANSLATNNTSPEEALVVSKKASEHNILLQKLLPHFSNLEDLIGGIHSWLKASLSGVIAGQVPLQSQAQPQAHRQPPTPTIATSNNKYNHHRDLNREIREQKHMQRLEILCEQSQKTSETLLALEQSKQLQLEQEVARLKTSLTESQKEKEQLKRNLMEASNSAFVSSQKPPILGETLLSVDKTQLEQQQIQKTQITKLQSHNFQLTMRLQASQKTVQELQSTLQERQRHYVKKVDELTCLSELQDSQVRQRDAVFQKVREDHSAWKETCSSKIEEALENVRKRDEQLRQEQFQSKLLGAENVKLRNRVTGVRLAVVGRPKVLDLSNTGGNKARSEAPRAHEVHSQRTMRVDPKPREASQTTTSTLAADAVPSHRFEAKPDKLLLRKNNSRETPLSINSDSSSSWSSSPKRMKKKKRIVPVNRFGAQETEGRPIKRETPRSESSSSLSSSKSKRIVTKKKVVPGESFGADQIEIPVKRARQKSASRRGQRLSLLVPSYDSLAEAGSSPLVPKIGSGKPIITIDSP